MGQAGWTTATRRVAVMIRRIATGGIVLSHQNNHPALTDKIQLSTRYNCILPKRCTITAQARVAMRVLASLARLFRGDH